MRTRWEMATLFQGDQTDFCAYYVDYKTTNKIHVTCSLTSARKYIMTDCIILNVFFQNHLLLYHPPRHCHQGEVLVKTSLFFLLHPATTQHHLLLVVLSMFHILKSYCILRKCYYLLLLLLLYRQHHPLRIKDN